MTPTRAIHIGLLCLTLLLLPTVVKAECSSLEGTYTYAFQAQVAPVPGAQTYTPHAVIGRITFSADGTFVDDITRNPGSGAVSFSVRGRYNLNSTNCTVTTSHPTFGIIAQGGKKIRVINTSAGIVNAFTAEKEE